MPFLRTILESGCRRILFSSTDARYVPGPDLMVDETSPVEPQSPYAASKIMVERILRDVVAATDLSAVSLRYFNPIGADPKLRTGLQLTAPSHALDELIEAYRLGEPFNVTGIDWPTGEHRASGQQGRPALRHPHRPALRRREDHRPAEGPPGPGRRRRRTPRRGRHRLAWQCSLLLRSAYRASSLAEGRRIAERVLTLFHGCPIRDRPPRPDPAPVADPFLVYFDTGQANNGGTKAVNGLIELHRRIARGFTNRDNYRLRMLLIVGALSRASPSTAS